MSGIISGDLEYIQDQSHTFSSAFGWLHSDHDAVNRIIETRNHTKEPINGLSPYQQSDFNNFRRLVIAGALSAPHGKTKVSRHLPDKLSPSATKLLTYFILGLHNDIEYFLASSGGGERKNLQKLTFHVLKSINLKSDNNIHQSDLIKLILNTKAFQSSSWYYDE